MIYDTNVRALNKGETMRVRWLGWAGVEIASGETTVVIDPLSDPGAVFAALGDAAREVALPGVGGAGGARARGGGARQPPAPRSRRRGLTRAGTRGRGGRAHAHRRGWGRRGGRRLRAGRCRACGGRT